MMKNGRIIDTNVFCVANGQHDTVSVSCATECMECLGEICEKKAFFVFIDDEGEILREYIGAIDGKRPYGVGGQALVWMIQNQYNPRRVHRVSLSRDACGNFVDFPSDNRLLRFDKSDKKFAALAKKTKTPVTNAVDTDWKDYLSPLNDNGIFVNFLCGESCDQDSLKQFSEIRKTSK